MKIVHRVAFPATGEQLRELDALGFRPSSVTEMPGGTDPFIAFDVGEDHPHWPSLRALLRTWGHSDWQVSTRFTKAEIESARWAQIGAWHHGYPQPDDDDFGYREATYDLTNWCEPCGMGVRQVAPFQMKREPRWGRNGIMQLVWVYGELFVTPEVWSRVFEPEQVTCRAVLGKRGVELTSVVQLVIDAAVSVETDGLVAETCERCGRTKFNPATRGRFPALRSVPTRPLVRTTEYFGSGGQADQWPLISRVLVRALARHGVRGAVLTPVAE